MADPRKIFYRGLEGKRVWGTHFYIRPTYGHNNTYTIYLRPWEEERLDGNMLTSSTHAIPTSVFWFVASLPRTLCCPDTILLLIYP